MSCKKGKDSTQQSDPAFKSYLAFCKSETRVSLGRRRFNVRLSEMGHPIKHVRKHNRFLGFELKRV